VIMQDGSQTVSWPRVSATCDFVGAAKFEDVLQIDVDIERLGGKSVTYAFLFSHSGTDIANGKMTTVCCHIQSGVPPRSIPIPADISEKLRAFLRT
ncbi:MAG: acyl-CoA thioesterase, partial [Planctomycetes bacterium]|nr:acyl-CoA thioesterase [Planctomycetota bacterium]